MVLVSLTEGDHTIEWSLNGYNTLNAVINVSTTGIVTCKSVTTGSCGTSTAPGVTISGNTITGYLLQAAANICTWISGLGGWKSIMSANIMSLVASYNKTDAGFLVSSTHIMGAVAYYGGKATNNPSNGNTITGCGFT